MIFNLRLNQIWLLLLISTLILAACSKDEDSNGTNNDNGDDDNNNSQEQEFEINTTGDADLNLKGNRAVFQDLDDMPPNEVTGYQKDKHSGVSITLFNKSNKDKVFVNIFNTDDNDGIEAKTYQSTVGKPDKLNTGCIVRISQRSGDDYYNMKGKGSIKVTQVTDQWIKGEFNDIALNPRDRAGSAKGKMNGSFTAKNPN